MPADQNCITRRDMVRPESSSMSNSMLAQRKFQHKFHTFFVLCYCTVNFSVHMPHYMMNEVVLVHARFCSENCWCSPRRRHFKFVVVVTGLVVDVLVWCTAEKSFLKNCSNHAFFLRWRYLGLPCRRRFFSLSTDFVLDVFWFTVFCSHHQTRV